MMRNLLVLGVVVLAAGCSMQPPAAPQVSWQYGAGNGDGVTYPGAQPTFTRAYGPGNGDGVVSGQTATEAYSYGAENSSGSMVQMAPPTRTQVAAPAPLPVNSAAPGTHS